MGPPTLALTEGWSCLAPFWEGWGCALCACLPWQLDAPGEPVGNSARFVLTGSGDWGACWAVHFLVLPCMVSCVTTMPVPRSACCSECFDERPYTADAAVEKNNMACTSAQCST